MNWDDDRERWGSTDLEGNSLTYLKILPAIRLEKLRITGGLAEILTAPLPEYKSTALPLFSLFESSSRKQDYSLTATQPVRIFLQDTSLQRYRSSACSNLPPENKTTA
jgi:hypothetical protein